MKNNNPIYRGVVTFEDYPNTRDDGVVSNSKAFTPDANGKLTYKEISGLPEAGIGGNEDAIASYNLNETFGSIAIDETGNYDSSFIGAPVLGKTVGVPSGLGTAVGFPVDGTDKLTIGNIQFGANDFSIAIWIKGSWVSQETIIISNDYGGVTWHGFAFEIFNTDDFRFVVRNNGVNAHVLDFVHTIDDGGWHFFVLQRQGNTIEAFVNGVSKGTQVSDDSNVVDIPTTPDITVSHTTRVSFSEFIGDYAQIEIRDRILTQPEVTTLYNSGNGVTLPPNPNLPEVIEKGASFTLESGQNDRFINCIGAAAKVVTVPLDTTETIPLGYKVNITQGGTGSVTITPEGGVTLFYNINNTPVIKGENNAVTLIKEFDNEWSIFGALTAI